MKLPARAQRVDEPAPGTLSIELYAAGERAYLLVSPALSPSLELRSERPRGESASPFVSQLRKHLAGAKLTRALVGGHQLALEFEGRAQLTLVGDRRDGFALVRDGRAILGSRKLAEPAGVLEAIDDLTGLRTAAGASLAARGRAAQLEAERTELRRTLGKELTRLERKRRAIEGDRARGSQAAPLRAEAEALLIHLGELERGAESVTLEFPDGTRRAIALDPRKRPQDEVSDRFKRARRLERGEWIATERLAEVDRRIDALRRELGRLEEADEQTLLALLEARPSQAPLVPRRGKRAAPERLPYRLFRSKDGLEILVGRSAADNDTLTLRIARPSDVFLHARGVTGSHVIVRSDRAELPVETLLDAATLAVHFSAAAKEPAAEVQYTERRYVRKGKGLAKGAVRLDRERVLLLRMQRERLRRLLDEHERLSAR
jgi:predicted ribosome quality control (RQC) complex YloA/Tae2 family protein